MILTLLLTVAVSGLSVLFGFLPTVTELPFGIDLYITSFAKTVRYVAYSNELFRELWIVFLIAFGFSITLFTIEWSIKVWRMIRG